MVKNNLYIVEKNLRSIAKRYKGVKYSLGLAILFLMMGLGAFAQEVMSTQEIAASKENLRSSVGTLQNKVEAARKENQKVIDGLRLELVQLMEQGDQVVKSPWASWQFGANYMYNDWRSTYKGRGDKAEKYPYEGVLERDSNEFNRYVAPNSSMYSSLETSTNARSASTNSRKGLNNYGLASNRMQQEPIVSLEVNAGITPRVINKKSPDTSPAAPDVTLPTFEPKLITPPVPPEKPDEPVLNPPELVVNVGSAGNDSWPVVMGHGSNSLIQEVAITGGDFKVFRNTTGPVWRYEYDNYTGRNAFHTDSTSQGFDASNDGIAG